MHKFTTRNVGRLDQILRLGISAGLLYVGFVDRSLIGDEFSARVLGAIGVLNLAVALLRICPLYTLAGINTCQTGHRD